MSHRVEIVRDFGSDEHRLIVDDYEVPYTRAFLKAETEDVWTVIFKTAGSMGCWIDVKDEELRRWVPFLAQVMAKCAGYTHFGEGSKLANPFGYRAARLSVQIDGDTIYESREVGELPAREENGQ